MTVFHLAMRTCWNRTGNFDLYVTKTDLRLVIRKELGVRTREDALTVSQRSQRFTSLTRETSSETREIFQRVKRS